MIETSADDRARGRESSVPPTLDLAHHFRELRLVVVPALVIALLCAAVVFTVRSSAPDRWSATVTARAESAATTAASSADAASAASLLDASYLALASDTPVLQSIVKEAGVPWTTDEAESRISLVEGTTPGLLQVTVLGDNAAQAAVVAKQAVLTLSASSRTHQIDAVTAQEQQVQATATAINARLQALAPTDPSRTALQQQYQSQLDQLGQLQVTGLSRLTALADPVTSDGPVSPQPLRDALLALVAVLIVVSELLVLLRGRLGRSTSRAWAGRMARKYNAALVDCAATRGGSGRHAETQRVESLVLRELRAGGDVLVLSCPPLSHPVLDTAILNGLGRPQAPERGEPAGGELIELSAEELWWRIVNPETVRLGVVVVARGSGQRRLALRILRWLNDAAVPAVVMLTDKVTTHEKAARQEKSARHEKFAKSGSASVFPAKEMRHSEWVP
ncbi:MAG: hypothetical protein ACXVGI_05450 [Mycobacteriaceae bacterium]